MKAVDMRRFSFLTAVLLLGCASTGGDDPRLNADAMRELGCIDKAQCELFWERAQVWVSGNSYYRVQLANDSVIETQGPLAGRMELAYRVIKIPDGKGGARIMITAECGNAFRCTPTVTDAMVAFKRYTRSGS